MKKFKKVLLVFVSVLALFMFASCSKVAGKTYTFDSFEYELAEGLTNIEKALIETTITGIKVGAENVKITFNEDGTCSLGNYTQDGSTVTIGGVEYKAKGKKLILEVEEEKYTYTITYVAE